jgi:hypothetical protein
MMRVSVNTGIVDQSPFWSRQESEVYKEIILAQEFDWSENAIRFTRLELDFHRDS